MRWPFALINHPTSIPNRPQVLTINSQPHVRACERSMLILPKAVCCSVDQQGRRGTDCQALGSGGQAPRRTPRRHMLG